MGSYSKIKLWAKGTLFNTNREVYLPYEGMDAPSCKWKNPTFLIDFFRNKIGFTVWSETPIKELSERDCREFLALLIQAQLILIDNKINIRNLWDDLSFIENDESGSEKISNITKQIYNLFNLENSEDNKLEFDIMDIDAHYEYFMWLIKTIDILREEDIDFYITLQFD